jgi:DNA-binding response OmpR family regulator
VFSILVVEDDPSVASALCESLSLNGFETTHVSNGKDAIDFADRFDLVLLDLGLPDLDGLEVCRRIRHVSTVPIIAVTARADEVDRVLGLTLGADDYVVKPYGNRELLARIEALMRRAGPRASSERGNRQITGSASNPSALPASGVTNPRRGLSDPSNESEVAVQGGSIVGQTTVVSRNTADDSVTVGPLKIDERAHRLWIRGEPIELARKEFAILALLAKEPGILIRREVLISGVWGDQWFGPSRTVDVHVSSLRQKLGVPDLIQTVRGIGYRLNDAAV